MTLSERERCELAVIEHALEHEDPRLAARFRRLGRRSRRWPGRAFWAGAAILAAAGALAAALVIAFSLTG